MGYPDDPVKKIMQRTMANLEYINKEDRRLKAEAIKQGKTRRDDDEPPFEATQLLNSFLGALIHPWESLRQSASHKFEKSLDDAEKAGWPVVRNQLPGAPESKTYAKMLSCIRNAFAHGSVRLLKDVPDQTGRSDISGVVIWNPCPQCNSRTWQAELSLDDLTAFLQLFEQLANEKFPRPRRTQIRRSEPW